MKSEDITIRENFEPMVRLDPAEFDLKPQYFKQGLTKDNSAWLRETVVEKLRAVKAMLPPGWNIRIWDAWRSMELQAALYDKYLKQAKKNNPTFSDSEARASLIGYIYPPISNPPPPHSTGGVIDLTFVDENGQAVDFGTGFDDLSERANIDYFDRHTPSTKADTQAKQHRTELIYFMNLQDFVVNPKEWWHFAYGTAQWAAAKGIERAIYGMTKPQ